MPSQIVLLKQSVIDSIVDKPETPLMISFGKRDMMVHPARLSDGSHALRIEANHLVYCPDVPNLVRQDVFAILITNTHPGSALPEPLPSAVVLRLLDETAAAFMEVQRLFSGHEPIAISAAIDAARSTAAPERSSDRKSFGC